VARLWGPAQGIANCLLEDELLRQHPLRVVELGHAVEPLASFSSFSPSLPSFYFFSFFFFSPLGAATSRRGERMVGEPPEDEEEESLRERYEELFFLFSPSLSLPPFFPLFRCSVEPAPIRSRIDAPF